MNRRIVFALVIVVLLLASLGWQWRTYSRLTIDGQVYYPTELVVTEMRAEYVGSDSGLTANGSAIHFYIVLPSDTVPDGTSLVDFNGGNVDFYGYFCKTNAEPHPAGIKISFRNDIRGRCLPIN